MRYLSTSEVAEKWGISPRRVGILCNENRIPGAQRAYLWYRFGQCVVGTSMVVLKCKEGK